MTQDPDARLAALQQRKLELTSSFELIKLNHEIASLARDELMDLELAADALREILDLDPADARALSELSALLRQLADFHGLMEILAQREMLCDTDDERVALNLEIATLADELLDDKDRAIDALRQVLLFSPTHARAWEGLERLYTVTERWSDLVELLELRVAFVSDVEERTRLLERLAAVCASQLEDDARAASYLARIKE